MNTTPAAPMSLWAFFLVIKQLRLLIATFWKGNKRNKIEWRISHINWPLMALRFQIRRFPGIHENLTVLLKLYFADTFCTWRAFTLHMGLERVHHNFPPCSGLLPGDSICSILKNSQSFSKQTQTVVSSGKREERLVFLLPVNTLPRPSVQWRFAAPVSTSKNFLAVKWYAVPLEKEKKYLTVRYVSYLSCHLTKWLSNSWIAIL